MNQRGQRISKISSKTVVPMRFRLSPKSIALKNKHNSLLETVKALNPLSTHMDHQKSTDQLQLKFCQKISEQHLLVGNEYQLNLLDFTNATKDYNEVATLWSIEHKDKITDIFMFHKINKIFVAHHSYLRCYGYKDEFMENAPLFHAQLKFRDRVDAIYSPKRGTLLVFAGTELTAFEMYAQNDSFKFNKLLNKTYRHQRKELSFLSLPPKQGQTLRVFFEARQVQEEPSNESHRIQSYSIYWLQIAINNLKDMEVSEITQYCKISTESSHQNGKMKILYYKQDIFLFLKNSELFAVRNSYIVDKIKLSLPKTDSFVLFGSKESIFCYNSGSLDSYVFSLNLDRKPQKFEIKCVDSSKFVKPDLSIFYKVVLLAERVVVIYYHPKAANSNQFSYWLAIAHHSDRKQKIQQIFGDRGGPTVLDEQSIKNHLQLAQKIGLGHNEAFFQIWNRCQKATKKDYEWLIATEDYNMIQKQLENKIKKNSLKFYEIALVLKSSLQMLKQKVRNNCSAEVVRQLSVCHFLYCKIQMFEKEKRQTLNEGEEIFINVQDYYYLLNLQLQKQLLDLLAELCIQKKAYKVKVRALLTQFSLIYRMLYHQILPKIVKSLRQNFLLLLNLIPQILPLKQTEDQTRQHQLDKGPWKKVDLETTNDYMLLCHYTSFQTEPFFSQFLSSKFYKVYQWHSHGAIASSLQDVEKAAKSNDANRVFTLLFQVLYEQKQRIGETVMKKIIEKIEEYEELPERLRGKFHFYCKLYQNFKDYFFSEKRSFLTVFEFFSLSEDELFLLYFKKERAKKGIFILKEIKPIYEEFAVEGRELFVKNMFKFFKSEDSSWSDLKIILNKFNNEKKDFHEENYNIFEVIVKGLMEKIQIGTDSSTEIGLEEVIAYLENIPFPLKKGELIENLYAITQIHQQEHLLKSLKINMSLRTLLENGEEVIFKMVERAVERNQVLKVESEDEMLMMAYKILAEIGEKQTKIYVDKHFKFVFKSFLIIVMQDQRQVSMCRCLISDPFIRQTFRVDSKLIENVVLYLYRKRLYQSPNYSESKGFINTLVQFIDPSSSKAKFIVLSQAFAKTFSFQKFKIKYPFFQGNYPTVTEIERLINSLKKQQISQIDQKNLFEVTFMLRMLAEEEQSINKSQIYALTRTQGIEGKRRLQHQIYTLVLLKLIREGLMERAIQITKDLVKISTENRVFNIIYPIFLLQILQKELLVRVKESIFRLVSHYFYSQNELLDIVVNFTRGGSFSNAEIDKFIAKKQQQKDTTLIFDPNNVVFSSSFKQFLKRSQINEKNLALNAMFETIWKQISCRREEFKANKIYNIIFRILLQDPFILAQYIYRKQVGINVKSLRALFTLLGFESVFNMKELFRVCKTIFQALMTKLQSSMLLGDAMQKCKAESTVKAQLIYTQEYLESQIKLTSHDLLGGSILIMNEKIIFLQKNPGIQNNQDRKYKQIEELMYSPEKYLKRKQEESQIILRKLHPKIYRLQNKIKNLENIKKEQYPGYPFNDHDHSYTETKYDLYLYPNTYAHQPTHFDEIRQRSEKSENLYIVQKIEVKKQNVGKQKTQECEQLYYEQFFQKIRSKKQVDEMQKLDRVQMMKTQETEDEKLLKKYYQSKCIQGGFLSLRQSGKQKNQSQEKSELSQSIVEATCLNHSMDMQEAFQLSTQSPLSKEIIQYLSERKKFNTKVLPRVKQEEINIFLESVIPQIYRRKDYSYCKRVELIYMIKSTLTGIEVEKQIVYIVSKRAAVSQQAVKMFSELQDLLPQRIFVENFDEKTLIEIVKEQAAENVICQQDYIKVAQLIGEIFCSSEVFEEVKLMFLIKLCRKYQKSTMEEKRNVKDEILFLANKIQKKKIQECIQIHRRTKNRDLLEISHLLQTIINLCTFPGNTSNE